MQRVVDATEAFWDYLSAVSPRLLAVGILCQLLKIACTSTAWRNVLAAAHPGVRIRWRSIYAAYLSGIGVNAILPVRAGDAVRIVLAHRAVPGSAYATVISSTLVLAIVDAVAALGVFAWAFSQGALPGLDILSSLPSFDFAWFFRHERVSEILLVLLVTVTIVMVLWGRRRVFELRARVGQAFAILRTPGRYVRRVVLWQLGDWTLRLATIWFFLGAFGIHQSMRNVLLVQATQSLATLVPISPGGIGTEQAFLLYTLRGEAPRTALLAFSVGMKLTLTAVNVVAGFTAMLLALRTVRFGRIAAQGDGATSDTG